MIATLFELPDVNPAHPAKYTDVLLLTFVDMLRGSRRILDPFGGTGKVFLLSYWYPSAQIEAVEIEPEWAAQNPRTTVGNALHLPWGDNHFDAICTSPTYGNQMAGNLRNPANWARPDYKYFTYAQMLNRHLHADNSGALQWGEKYRQFHVKAWTEARRVLEPGGKFVLNVKDHIRAGKRQYVTDWHIETLEGLGFMVKRHEKIDAPSMRFGANGGVRIEYESVILFEAHA